MQLLSSLALTSTAMLFAQASRPEWRSVQMKAQLELDRESTVEVPATAMLVDGCSGGGNYAPWGEPRFEATSAKAGEATCWNEEKQMATRHGRDGKAILKLNDDGSQVADHVDCTTPDGIRSNESATPSWTYAEAKAICEAGGMRLCQSQEEMDASCGTGCHFNAVMNWMETPQTHAVLLDGCFQGNPDGNYAPWGAPRVEDQSVKAGEAICWNEDKQMATRHGTNMGVRGEAILKLNDDGTQVADHENCTTPDGVRSNESATPSWTYAEAKAICENGGMRLCQTQEELDASCGTGCHFNAVMAWVEGTTTTTTPPPTPAPTPEPTPAPTTPAPTTAPTDGPEGGAVTSHLAAATLAVVSSVAVFLSM